MRGLVFLLSGLVLFSSCGREASTSRNMTSDEVAAELGNMSIEPGLWELTSEVLDVSAPGLPREVRNRMVGPRSRIRNCITPEQAAHPSANFLAGRAESECAYRDFSVRDGAMRGSMSCPDATAQMQGRYEPRAYDLRMEMRSPMQNKAVMTLQLRARGRLIGPCENAKA